MKNRNTAYPPSGQFLDFLILLAIFISISSAVFLSSNILFGIRTTSRCITVESELMPYIHLGKLSEGDTVYDTVSKRSLGSVSELSVIEKDGGFCYRFTLEGTAYPKGRALRTKRIWFYFKEVKEE